jgi:hypothetical protein
LARQLGGRDTALSDPYGAQFADRLERYAKSILVEVATLSWRSAFKLGHSQEPLHRTHFMALSFQHVEGQPTLRKSYKLLRADVMNVKNEMSRRQPGHQHVLGLPTEAELSGGTRREMEDRIGDTVSATMVFFCMNPKSGKQASCSELCTRPALCLRPLTPFLHLPLAFTDMRMHNKNTWLYRPLKDTRLNDNWEYTLQVSLSMNPGLSANNLIELDFTQSEGEEEEKRVKEQLRKEYVSRRCEKPGATGSRPQRLARGRERRLWILSACLPFTNPLSSIGCSVKIKQHVVLPPLPYMLLQ